MTPKEGLLKTYKTMAKHIQALQTNVDLPDQIPSI